VIVTEDSLTIRRDPAQLIHWSVECTVSGLLILCLRMNKVGNKIAEPNIAAIH
jgi:hypothetical protein